MKKCKAFFIHFYIFFGKFSTRTNTEQKPNKNRTKTEQSSTARRLDQKIIKHRTKTEQKEKQPFPPDFGFIQYYENITSDFGFIQYRKHSVMRTPPNFRQLVLRRLVIRQSKNAS